MQCWNIFVLVEPKIFQMIYIWLKMNVLQLDWPNIQSDLQSMATSSN